MPPGGRGVGGQAAGCLVLTGAGHRLCCASRRCAGDVSLSRAFSREFAV